jgi:hypothetical protein
MAIAYGGLLVQSSYYAGSATSRAFTLTGAASAGSKAFIDIAVGNPNSVTVNSVTDSRGNTWTIEQQLNNGTTVKAARAYAQVGTALQVGDTITVTLSASSQRWSVVAYYFTGLVSSGPLDKTASATGSSTSPSVGPSATTTQADELVLACYGTTTDAATAYGSNTLIAQQVTAAGSTERRIVSTYRIVSSTGTQSASATLASSQLWVALLGTYKAGTGGTVTGEWAGISSAWDGMQVRQSISGAWV